MHAFFVLIVIWCLLVDVRILGDSFLLGLLAQRSLYRVRTGPGKPGKSWNSIVTFSRTFQSWKKATVPGKFWKSVKCN